MVAGFVVGPALGRGTGLTIYTHARGRFDGRTSNRGRSKGSSPMQQFWSLGRMTNVNSTCVSHLDPPGTETVVDYG